MLQFIFSKQEHEIRAQVLLEEEGRDRGQAYGYHGE